MMGDLITLAMLIGALYYIVRKEYLCRKEARAYIKLAEETKVARKARLEALRASQCTVKAIKQEQDKPSSKSKEVHINDNILPVYYPSMCDYSSSSSDYSSSSSSCD